MPRLVGKKSNTALYTLLGVLVALGLLTALEYEGVIDVVPGFGTAKVQTGADNTRPIAPKSNRTN